VNLFALLINLDSSQKQNLIMAERINGRFIPESKANTCGKNEFIIGMDFFGATDIIYAHLFTCVDDPHNRADIKNWAVELIEEINEVNKGEKT
jgi:hypothetical protein